MALDEKKKHYLANMATWAIVALVGGNLLRGDSKVNKFTYSQNSLNNLEGIDPTLHALALLALQLSPVDFGIIDGLRTAQETAANIASGASQVASRSAHEDGLALDFKVVGPQTIEAYSLAAQGFRDAAAQLGISCRWGGAWVVLSPGLNPKMAVSDYMATKRKAGKKAFTDLGHIELYPKAMIGGRWVYQGKKIA